MASLLRARHIQNMSEADVLVPHWGYAPQAFPCVKDSKTCAYLDAVYKAHDVSILYSAILWAVIGGILFIFVVFRLLQTWAEGRTRTERDYERGRRSRPGFFRRLFGFLSAARRKWLLPQAFTKVFGHVSRLQIAILAAILIYLLIFTLIGGVYNTWRVPIKGTDKFMTRTGIGVWGNRMGILAFALTPLTIMLASRESILSLITGVPYQHFIFLHRWIGRIMYVQASLHTLSWTIVEGYLYQPQPKTYRDWIAQKYAIWGCIAIALISFLFFFSFRGAIQKTGYEFFRKSHYVVAMLYLGACWGHWSALYCWMLASLILWGIDRSLRLLRTSLIHAGRLSPDYGIGFRAIPANMTLFSDPSGPIVRLDFAHFHKPWAIGQHYFLTFPNLSLWQAHPVTPASLPSSGSQSHTYIIRGLAGETGRLAELARAESTTPVILSGPYGKAVLEEGTTPNVLAVAGGTGVTFTLPIVWEAMRRKDGGAVWLVWVVKTIRDLAWIGQEVATLKEMAGANGRLQVRIYVTRPDDQLASTSEEKNLPSEEDMKALENSGSLRTVAEDGILATDAQGFHVEYLHNGHPDFSGSLGQNLMEEWLGAGVDHREKYQVFGSGPASMGRDLRITVAANNKPGAAWRGEGGEVGFYWDDRFQ